MEWFASQPISTDEKYVQIFQWHKENFSAEEKAVLSGCQNEDLYAFSRRKKTGKREYTLLFLKKQFKKDTLIDRTILTGSEKQFYKVAVLIMNADTHKIKRKKYGLLGIKTDLSQSDREIATASFNKEKQVQRLSTIQKTLEIWNYSQSSPGAIKVMHREGFFNLYKNATSLFSLANKDAIIDPQSFITALSKQFRILAFHHSEERVHGDIKPENIVLKLSKTKAEGKVTIEKIDETYFIDSIWYSSTTTKQSMPHTGAYIPTEETAQRNALFRVEGNHQLYECDPDILRMRDIKSTIWSWLYFIHKNLANTWAKLNEKEYELSRGITVIEEEEKPKREGMLQRMDQLIDVNLRQALMEYMANPEVVDFLMSIIVEKDPAVFNRNKAKEIWSFLQSKITPLALCAMMKGIDSTPTLFDIPTFNLEERKRIIQQLVGPTKNNTPPPSPEAFIKQLLTFYHYAINVKAVEQEHQQQVATVLGGVQKLLAEQLQSFLAEYGENEASEIDQVSQEFLGLEEKAQLQKRFEPGECVRVQRPDKTWKLGIITFEKEEKFFVFWPREANKLGFAFSQPSNLKKAEKSV